MEVGTGNESGIIIHLQVLDMQVLDMCSKESILHVDGAWSMKHKEIILQIELMLDIIWD